MAGCARRWYFGRVKVQRHAQIVARLRSGGAVSVGELSHELGVSASTIRRDLHELDETGILTRVHGGASLTPFLVPDADTERPFDAVAQADRADKEAVAKRAAGLVRDGEVVLLDIGTTTRLIARQLRGRRVTIGTNSLAVLDELRDDDDVELILLGGMVRRAYHSLVGVLTEDALRQLRADRAFIGTSGIDREGYVMDTTIVEVPVKRAMIAAATQVVVVADRHKVPGNGSLRVCGPEKVDVLITNDGADEAILALCAGAGVEVLRS